MTTVALNFSQATLDALAAQRAASPIAPTLGQVFNQVVQAGYDFAANHYYYSDILLEAPEGWLTYPDGGYQYFYGMTKTGTTSGAITTTRLEDYVPDAYKLTYDGQLKFGYTTTPASGTVLTNEGGTINSVTLESRLAASDARYDQVFGNTVTTVKGALSTVDTVQFNSTVTSIDTTADNVLASTRITGSITASGNTVDVGLGTASAMVSGTITSLVQTYVDGSTFTISSPLAATGALVLDDRILADNTYFLGNDTISVTLPASATSPTSAYNTYSANGGDGNDRITISGAGGMLSANGGNGNDTIVLGDHGHTVYGGAGMDTAIFNGTRAAYTVAAGTSAAGNSTVTLNGGAGDTLSGIERIQFDNAYVALDITGNAGQAYRLYQAAFHRTPDSDGLGYWIKQMDNGMSLREMARHFSNSPEFQSLYGVQPTNAELVTNFYRNALHREAEPAGRAYWLDVLDRNLVTATEMLAFFSESAENQAAVQPVIITGIGYTPYG